MTFFWIAAFWCIGWALLIKNHWFTKFQKLTLAYPVGLALFSVVTSLLWFFGVRWSVLYAGWFLVAVLSFFWVIPQEIVFFQENSKRSSILTFWKKLKDAHDHFSVKSKDFPFAFFAFIATVSLAIVSFWHLFVYPVHWDSLSLYEFRGMRLTQGWQLNDFLQSERYHNALFLYDFHHPWGQSFLSALATEFGEPYTSHFLVALLLSLLTFAGVSFISWQALAILAFLLLGFETSFSRFIEGYSVIPAALFWGFIALAWSDSKRTRGISYWGTLMLFLTSAMTFRVSEPFWMLALITIAVSMVRARERIIVFLLFLFPVASWATWWFVQKNALTYFSIALKQHDPVIGVLSVQWWKPELLISITTQLGASPASLFWLVTAFAYIFMKSTRKYISPALLLLSGSMLGLIAMGMVVYALPNPQGWLDIRQAFDRAVLPIWIVIAVMIAKGVDRYVAKHP